MKLHRYVYHYEVHILFAYAHFILDVVVLKLIGIEVEYEDRLIWHHLKISLECNTRITTIVRMLVTTVFLATLYV